MRTAAVALLLLLAACGGGSSGEPSDQAAPSKAPAAEPTPSATTAPAVVTPAGEAIPEALSRFRCEQDAKGSWNAAGYVSNSVKAPRTFQVTVYIGDATGGVERAKTTQVASVAPGGSVAFRINKVPAPQDGGPCHVQVVATG
ncbi:MAG: hypothetical protein JWP31_13 [Aeromicrobium sp.]|nr:hypothetical protein [Aeromicrobium sp.]